MQDCCNPIANAVELPQSCTKHSISQPPRHPCFAQAIELIAHPKIILILPFSWGISSKKGILHIIKFCLHTPSCHFWLNLWHKAISIISIIVLLMHQYNACLTLTPLVMPYGDIFGTTLDQVMARCLMAPSHYLSQCWFLIGEVLWHSRESNATRGASHTILYNELKNQTLITATSPRSQWVNSMWPNDAIWQHGSRSTLVQVMACCLTASGHYLNKPPPPKKKTHSCGLW